MQVWWANLSLVKLYLGKLANLAGVPCFVRECDYRSHAIGAHVTVKRLEMYTLVTVNGVDVYFNRFSGKIDGVGASLASGCSAPQVPESTDSVVAPAHSPLPIRKRTTED